MSLLRRALARVADSAARYRRDVRHTYRALTDRGSRAALLYLFALAFAGLSFLLFLLSDSSTPSGFEFGLLMGSFGVVLYMSITQAGHAPRRGR